MKTWRMEYYNRFRKLGYGASLAWENAKIVDRFERESDDGRGRVRIVADPEEDSYFDVFGKPDTDKERDAIAEAIDRYGCWYVHTDTRCPACDSWTIQDGVGMNIHADPTSPFENPYVVDMMSAALAALDNKGCAS